MPVNDFLPFATAGNANVLTQAAYAALGTRGAGFQSGVAQSEQVNKVLRQSAFMAAVLAQFAAEQSSTDIRDAGDLAATVAALLAAVTHVSQVAIAGGNFATVPQLNAEVSARQAADTAEASTRAGAVAAEAQARGGADVAEAQARAQADTQEAAIRSSQITLLDAAWRAAVTAEQGARGTGDAALSSRIQDEITARGNAVAGEAAARAGAVTAEALARVADDVTQAQIRAAEDVRLENLINLRPTFGSFQSSGLPDGFERSPSGIITQWGTRAGPTGLLDPHNFALAFPNECYAVVASEANGAGWGNPPQPTLYGIQGANQFGFYCSAVRFIGSTTATYQGGIIFHYLAIGR